jgi:hypothetical protein
MTIDSFTRAGQHPIALNKPAVRFFEGAVLGNGALGAIVCTRPDAVAIHFGHNNVWDIRVDESHASEVLTFDEVFEKVSAVPEHYASLEDDPWCKAYFARMREPYRKLYPRPFPCGTLLLAFDRREAELLGHTLHIDAGLCEVRFLVQGVPATLQIFVEPDADRVWLRMVNAGGQPISAPFNRIRLIPDPDTPNEMPACAVHADDAAGQLSFTQVLPFQEPHAYDMANGHPKDRAFALSAVVSDVIESQERFDWAGNIEQMHALERALISRGAFTLCAHLDDGLARELAVTPLPEPTPHTWETQREKAVQHWQAYWRKSGVALDDEMLESTWYRNLYFLNCAAKAGATPPGLFANWSYRKIGTAWHGDYHMNYNTQQPFWAAFSSNHLEKHEPYVELVHFLLPISRKWAREYYKLPGAYYPHSAYPVEMNVMPYPVPDWGWEICETPWTVQSLWWHYLYSQDKQFLAGRAFEPIKAAVEFLVAYMKRPASLARFNDGLYHIFPTVPPELYGLRPGFDKCYDCLVDLTLTKFVLKAFVQMCDVLEMHAGEMALIAEAKDVLAHLPAYPTAESPIGTVFVSAPGERAGIVYNTPDGTMTVFPGEDHGLGSPREQYEIACNSYRYQRNEGGNELVFLNVQGARLGLLDLEKFKRQIEYCRLPNGTCADMVLQSLGRYRDTDPAFEFMAPMGIWFENFGLPFVINECLMQSYDGVVRLFPNWPADKAASFTTLRAVGAFLVSASFADGTVQRVEVESEAGGLLRMMMPAGWAGATAITPNGTQTIAGAMIEIQTRAGDRIELVIGNQ